MGSGRFDCDCDKVIEMEEIGVGPEEILQYARAVLTRDSLRALVRGLDEILSELACATEPGSEAEL